MKLLLAEDEVDMSEALVDILTYHKYTVDAVLDGEEALDYATIGEYDGIILDIMMPKMSGLEVLQKLRNRGDRTPVLLLTAKAEVEDRIAGLDMGADDYLPKPFAMGELLARIRTAIRHTRTSLDNGEIAQSGKFTVRDLTIDYDKHHVLVGGEDVHLTLNEFKIVALLGKYAGKVLTYDYLIKQIWGPKAKADNQILRVNMANIRRKIEKNPASPEYIFTEIGVGYRMLESNE